MPVLSLQLSTATPASIRSTGAGASAIVLSANTIAENAALGAAVGTLSTIGTTGTAAFTLVDSAGSRFALSGANVQRGATALDYEAATSHNIIVSVSGVTPTIANATLAISVTNVAEIPVNSVAPTLSPTSGAVGTLLTCGQGTWSNTPTSYAYQWMRTGVDISGETASTYTTVLADDTLVITCKVLASNADGPGAGYVTTSNSHTAGAASYQAESLVIFAAMTGLDDPRKTVIDNLVASLKTAGVWTKLDFLHVYAAHNSGASLVNWKNPGTWNASAVNSPTFTVDRGYAGNGTTSYVNTNYNPSTAGGNLTLNSAHTCVWARTHNEIGPFLMGNFNGANGTGLIALRPTLFVGYQNSGGNVNAATATDRYYHTITRGVSSDIDFFTSGANKETKADVSVVVANLVVWVCAANSFSYATSEIAAAHMGSDLSDAEVASASTAFTTYMTAVGA